MLAIAVGTSPPPAESIVFHRSLEVERVVHYLGAACEALPPSPSKAVDIPLTVLPPPEQLEFVVDINILLRNS